MDRPLTGSMIAVNFGGYFHFGVCRTNQFFDDLDDRGLDGQRDSQCHACHPNGRSNNDKRNSH